MTEKRYKPKIRRKEQNTPLMKGRMHINIWVYNYAARLSRRKYLMLNVRRKFVIKTAWLVM